MVVGRLLARLGGLTGGCALPPLFGLRVVSVPSVRWQDMPDTGRAIFSLSFSMAQL
jgi:hypothetical protein